MFTIRRSHYLSSRFTTIILFLLLSGCSISLISRYDEVIDRGITDFQRKVDLHLAQKTRIPTSAYNEVFYDEVFTDLQILQTRASSVEKNEKTSELIATLVRHLTKIQSAEQKGTSTGETYRLLQETIDQTCGNLLALELAKKREH